MKSPIENLPVPKPKFDLVRLRPPMTVHGEQLGFGTYEQAKKEDAWRAKSTAAAASDLEGNQHAHAEDLARRLAGDQAHQSLASACYMWSMKRNVSGCLLELAHHWKTSDLRLVTLLSSKWEVPADELLDFHPRTPMEQLRAQLNRAGADHSTGFGIFFLDSEHEPTDRLYRFHVHGLVAGGMIDVVKSLKDLDVYQPRPQVRKPHQLNRIASRNDRPEVVSYLVKSFWPSKRIGPVGKDGEVKRNRFDARIPEPDHTQALLWLDRYRLGDLALLMKCRCRPTGIELTEPMANSAYTRPKPKGSK